MHKLKRKNYVSPESVVTHVELESPICSGSADFVGEEASGVNIQAQDVTTPTFIMFLLIRLPLMKAKTEMPTTLAVRHGAPASDENTVSNHIHQ